MTSDSPINQDSAFEKSLEKDSGPKTTERVTVSRDLILHDLEQPESQSILPEPTPDLTVFAALPKVKNCQGCFNCWVKTPGRCIIKDRGSDFAHLIATHDRLTLVSRLVFGGLSPAIKAIIDRSIGYILPFFEYRDGQMFHRKRYPKSPEFRYFYYGLSSGQGLNKNLEAQMETAKKLAKAHQRNFTCPRFSVEYFSSPEALKEALRLA
ncbi:MAG: hypothetical protein LBS44_04275 [Deltaproteobacteria bacterium]|nr:hypothetical protein [Deltaproteobacteria bacterium]